MSAQKARYDLNLKQPADILKDMPPLKRLIPWTLCFALAGVPSAAAADKKDETRDYEKSKYIAPSPEVGTSVYIYDHKGDPAVRDDGKDKKGKKKKKKEKGKRKKISKKPGKRRPKGYGGGSKRKSVSRSAPEPRDEEPEEAGDEADDDVGTSRGGAIKVGTGKIRMPKKRTAPRPRESLQQGGVGSIYGGGGETEGGDKKPDEAKGEKVSPPAGGGAMNFGSAIPTQ